MVERHFQVHVDPFGVPSEKKRSATLFSMGEYWRKLLLVDGTDQMERNVRLLLYFFGFGFGIMFFI